VNCTNTVENMMKCLKKVHFWWSVVILALRVLKIYTLLVKIVPKRIKKTVISDMLIKLYCYSIPLVFPSINFLHHL